MDALSVVRQMRPQTGEWEDRAWFPPGPKLAVCLSGGFDGLGDAELLELAAAARRQTSWAQARELAAIAELSHRRTTAAEQDGDDADPGHRTLSAHESVVEEVAAALTLTGNSAAALVTWPTGCPPTCPPPARPWKPARSTWPRRGSSATSPTSSPTGCPSASKRPSLPPPPPRPPGSSAAACAASSSGSPPTTSRSVNVRRSVVAAWNCGTPPTAPPTLP